MNRSAKSDSRDLVSIICPCYNAESTIRNLIDDIRSQTYEFWELILVSNGENQDKQICLIEKLIKDDNRIKLIHEKVGGVSLARNIGIDVSRGKWITFVDADDRIDKNHLQNYIDVLDDKSELVVIGVEVYDEKSNKLIEIIQLKDLDTLKSQKGIYDAVKILMSSASGISSVWNKLFSSKIIKNNALCFDPTLPFAEDYIFCLQYIMSCGRLQLVDRTSYHYMRNPNSACHRFHPNMKDCLKRRADVTIQFFEYLGYDDDIINEKQIQLDYHRLYNTITNLYKFNCPLSHREKIAEIAMIINDIGNYREIIKKWRSIDSGFLQEKIFDTILVTGIPIFIHASLSVLFWLWKKVKS